MSSSTENVEQSQSTPAPVTSSTTQSSPLATPQVAPPQPSYSGRVTLDFASGIPSKRWDDILLGLGIGAEQAKEAIRRRESGGIVNVTLAPDKVSEFVSKAQSPEYARYFDRTTPYYDVSHEDRGRYEAQYYRYQEAAVSWDRKEDKLKDELKGLMQKKKDAESILKRRDDLAEYERRMQRDPKDERWMRKYRDFKDELADAERLLPQIEEAISRKEQKLQEARDMERQFLDIAYDFRDAMRGIGIAPADVPAAAFWGAGMGPGVGLPVEPAPKKAPEAAKPLTDIEAFQELKKQNPNLVAASFVTDVSSGRREVTSTTEKPAKSSSSINYDVSVSEDRGSVTFTPKGHTTKADPLGALLTAPTEEGLAKGKIAAEKMRTDLTPSLEKEQAALEKQAKQQLGYEAFQQTTKEAQQEALLTGKAVTVTQERIEAKKQELALEKYAEGVPVVDQKAAAEALRANYAGFKANTIVESANKGQSSAYTLTDADVKSLEKAGVQVETAKEIQALPGKVNAYNTAVGKVDRMLTAASQGKSTDVRLSSSDIKALEAVGFTGLQDKSGLVVAKPSEINSYIDFISGKGAADSAIAEPSRTIGLLRASPFYVEQVGPRGTIERINLATPVFVADDITKPHNVRQIWVAPQYGPQPRQQLVKDVPSPTDPASDFGKGFAAEAENLGKSMVAAGQSLQQIWFREVPRTVRDAKGNGVYTNRPEQEYKPGVGTDLTGLGITAATELATTGKTSVQWSDLQKVGENIGRNPAYFVGNLAFEAMTFFGPGLATKGAKGVQAVKLAADVKQVEKALSPLGSAVRIERDLIDVGTESDAFRYAVGRFTKIEGKPGVEFFTRQIITSPEDLLVQPSRLTVYVRPAVEIGKRGSEQLIDIGKLPKDIPKSFPLARKGSEFYELVEGVQGRGDVFEKLSPFQKGVQSSEGYTTKELQDVLSTEQGIKKFMGTHPESVGFRVGKGSGGGAGAGKGTLAIDFVQELQRAEKAAAKGAAKGSGVLVTAGITGAGSLVGIGGATSASAREQKELAESFVPSVRAPRSKKDNLADDVYLRYPADLAQPTIRGSSSIKNLQKDIQNIGGRMDTSHMIRQFDTSKMIDNFKLDAPVTISTDLRTDSLTSTSQVTVPAITASLQQRQIQQFVPQPDIPSLPQIRIGFPFGWPDEPRQKSKGRISKARTRYFERMYEVPEVLEVAFGSKQAKRLVGYGRDDWTDILRVAFGSKKGKKSKKRR